LFGEEQFSHGLFERGKRMVEAKSVRVAAWLLIS
jgi:hypothetical protein